MKNYLRLIILFMFVSTNIPVQALGNKKKQDSYRNGSEEILEEDGAEESYTPKKRKRKSTSLQKRFLQIEPLTYRLNQTSTTSTTGDGVETGSRQDGSGFFSSYNSFLKLMFKYKKRVFRLGMDGSTNSATLRYGIRLGKFEIGPSVFASYYQDKNHSNQESSNDQNESMTVAPGIFALHSKKLTKSLFGEIDLTLSGIYARTYYASHSTEPNSSESKGFYLSSQVSLGYMVYRWEKGSLHVVLSGFLGYQNTSKESSQTTTVISNKTRISKLYPLGIRSYF